MRFDLLSLELFVTVYEEGNIAKAADRHHIAASAVSKRIADLEAKLDAALFRRTSRGLEPTAAAEALLHHARVVMRDIRQMELELVGHATGVAGQIRLNASVSTIIQHLPNDLHAFLADHPGVRIDIEEGTSQQAVAAVAENAADIGVFGGAVLRSGLRVLPYRSDRLAVLLPVGHELGKYASVTFAQIAEYDLIGTTKGSYLDSLIMRAAADLGRPPKMSIRVNGFETVCYMVEAQLGLGLVPIGCALRYVAAGKTSVIALDEPWAFRQWNVCVREGPLPPPIRLLLEHLCGEAAVS